MPLQHYKADLFKALGHPDRIRILELLRGGEKNVGELQAAIGLEGSSTSQQLAVLRNRNLVDSRKAGNVTYYRIRDDRVNDILDGARAMFDEHVRGLRRMGAGRELAGARRG